MAHTPGPWKVANWSGGETHVIQEGSGATICKMPTGWPEEDLICNARLIAAAPELLAALEKCEWVPDAGYPRCPACKEWRRTGVHTDDCHLAAALAKAKENGT